MRIITELMPPGGIKSQKTDVSNLECSKSILIDLKSTFLENRLFF
jgi:hypothetical protein